MLDVIRRQVDLMELGMGQNREYVVGTTHHCMVRMHGRYHTIVHIGSYRHNGEYKGPSKLYLYECIAPNGLFKVDFAPTVEDAFRAGWDAIVAHMETDAGE